MHVSLPFGFPVDGTGPSHMQDNRCRWLTHRCSIHRVLALYPFALSEGKRHLPDCRRDVAEGSVIIGCPESEIQ